MKRIVALSLCVCLTVCGCSWQDAGELSPVTACGIARSNNGYQLTAELAQPSADTPIPDAVTVSGSAPDLLRAIDTVSTGRDAQFYWSHTQIVLLDESVLTNGIVDLTDTLVNAGEIRASVRLCAVRYVSAQTFLEEGTSLSGDPVGFALGDSIKQAVSQSQTPDMPLYRVFNALHTDGLDAVLPAVTLEGGQAVLDGCLLLSDGKPAGWLNKQQTAVLSLLYGDGDSAVFYTGAQRMQLHNPKISITADISQPEPVFHLTLTVQTDCASNGQTQRTADVLQQECLRLIQTLQHTDCDALGFGRAWQRTDAVGYAARTTDWTQSSVQVTVTAHALPNAQGGR